MKKRVLASLLLGLVLLLSACTSSNGESSSLTADPAQTEQSAEHSESAYHKITADEAKTLMEEGDVTVVDVRTAEEYAETHIPDAILVPVESIGDDMPEALADQDAVLLVYCRTGIRSKQASDKLVELGYTQVYDFGGIRDWPYEQESGDAE